MARTAAVKRSTKETVIEVSIDLDGSGVSDVSTGIPFYDHMLDQLARHGNFDLTIKAEGDKLRRAAELTAVLGQILKTEGLPDADDKEYATLCDELIAASVAVKGALDRGDAAAVGTAVGGIQQACNKCHENYR